MLLLVGAGSPSNTYNVAWEEAYLLTKWHLDPSSPLATIEWAENWEGTVPLLGGDGSSSVKVILGHQGHSLKTTNPLLPSNTISPRPRPISVPSGILIHPPVSHNRHRPKILAGGLYPYFWGRELMGPHITQSHLGRGLPPCQVSY